MSRLPVPIACEMPIPERASRHVTACMPVPEAPITPMEPRGTALANPSGTPSIIAVPQSGPITNWQADSPALFSSTSAASGTLSLNRNAFRPR